MIRLTFPSQTNQTLFEYLLENRFPEIRFETKDIALDVDAPISHELVELLSEYGATIEVLS